MSQEKQEADYTADVDALLPRLEEAVTTQSLRAALELIVPLEKRARGAGDLLSTSRLLLVALLMIRTTPSVDKTDVSLLCETITAYSKKHGQLKQAITRMVQLAMLFLQDPVGVSAPALTSTYAVIGKDSLQEDAAMADAGDADDVEMEKPEEARGEKNGAQGSAAAAKPDDDERRQGKEDDRITALMQSARAIGRTGLDEDARLRLIETLREVTEGKVFVEVERARVSRTLSDMLYARGEVDKAADTLQDLAVETFGSLARREKVEFILEQMRLNLERGDYHRVNMFSRKINTKFFEDPSTEELKLLFYDLMIRCGTHERKYLDVCKYYREVLSTPKVQADEGRMVDALQNVIIFVILSPFDHEQSDLMGRVEANENLHLVPQYKSLLKCFTTPELMRWPGIEAMYGPALKQTTIFSGGDDAEYRWKQLHARVVEHNIQVVSKYYTKLRLQRLAQLLDLSEAEAEDALADLVTKHAVHARIDRPLGLINFQPRMSDAEVLNNWSSDMGTLLRTVEKVSHLVEKEWAIHRAGLVVKANE
ncbi:proteasome regulatory particle subunit [Malassezia sp. CBS 17886]|nr:proteasome regulatory particle subunit [Malassezia sp. CBS 17886]